MSGPTGSLGEEFDMCMLPGGKAGGWLVDSVREYCGSKALTDPLVSFLLDEGKTLPPTYISTGTADRLYAEDIALAINRSARGETIVFDLWVDPLPRFRFCAF
jgi:hypothetical protein